MICCALQNHPTSDKNKPKKAPVTQYLPKHGETEGNYSLVKGKNKYIYLLLPTSVLSAMLEVVCSSLLVPSTQQNCACRDPTIIKSIRGSSKGSSSSSTVHTHNHPLDRKINICDWLTCAVTAFSPAAHNRYAWQIYFTQKFKKLNLIS